MVRSLRVVRSSKEYYQHSRPKATSSESSIPVRPLRSIVVILVLSLLQASIRIASSSWSALLVSPLVSSVLVRGPTSPLGRLSPTRFWACGGVRPVGLGRQLQSSSRQFSSCRSDPLIAFKPPPIGLSKLLRIRMAALSSVTSSSAASSGPALDKSIFDREIPLPALKIPAKACSEFLKVISPVFVLYTDVSVTLLSACCLCLYPCLRLSVCPSVRLGI
jgi:hypothetical protein